MAATAFVGLALVAGAGAPAAARSFESSSDAVDALPAATVRAALAAPGETVRRAPGLTVKRVSVAGLAKRAGRLSERLWRVRLRGDFPPRALRYVVTAGSEPVAYGIPGPHLRSLSAVTADPAVLEAPVTTRYGDGPTPAPGAGPSAAPVKPPPPDLARGLQTGPNEVKRDEYHLGNQAFLPSGFDTGVELTADVHYPKGLSRGPYPLVLFLHGNHVSCFKGVNVTFEWPCRNAFKPLPNYAGYDYIARRLASFGFVVVSVSTNGVNVLGSPERFTGMKQRGELLQKHLDLWHRWSTNGGGPFGPRFVGKVDFDRLGTMGHSRGGEGAVWQVILDRQRPDPYGIDAILPLAPVDFSRKTVNNVPMSVMLPYCDGDVFDLQGIHFFDDARYRLPGDPTPKHTVTVFGANHNFFNTVWSPGHGFPGASDDGVRHCSQRLGQRGERRVGSLFITDYFRRYLKDNLALEPIWTGAEQYAELSADRAPLSYHAPDQTERRLDLDRFTEADDVTTDQLGGAITATGLSRFQWCSDTFDDPCLPDAQWTFRDVHLEGLARATLGWSTAGGVVRFEIPAGQGDVSGFDALQFRTSPNPSFAAGRAHPQQNLVVRLEDGNGDTADVAASAVDDVALALPPDFDSFDGHVILNQLRFPLSGFAGADLTDVRAVELRFSETDRGVIDVADVAFTSGTG